MQCRPLLARVPVPPPVTTATSPLTLNRLAAFSAAMLLAESAIVRDPTFKFSKQQSIPIASRDKSQDRVCAAFKMPKRKRGGEANLEENIGKWRKELVRGLKTAKGFERQRLSKRIREADPEKTARLEKEVLVLKSLDLQQAAHAHLCSSLLKIKGVAESPNLPADIKPVPKPELSEEERAALHNVTSALCNRKQVKDVIEQAIMGTCIALRVPMPDKKNKGSKTREKEKEKEKVKAGAGKSKTLKKEGKDEPLDEEEDLDSLADDESDDPEEEAGLMRLTLLRRKAERSEDEEDLESHAGSESAESAEFEGFSDSEAEEHMFSKYDKLVGGSSDEDESDEEGNSSDDNDGPLNASV
ncbi:hypothetical protein NPX13_g11439 [Xylaria arbuscula]|uniref:Bud22 domain-containing protein n=1 Tax=Xylaria arbuscula TaxID=114810 RepID=A0A9W8N2U9_9PEZI|nr:hypothetical protein NPX13_g11439 [Xylaria arbuscula]